MSLEKEWTVAREVIQKVDERVLAIRKLGFGFVTTLLTADTFLFHSAKESGGPVDGNLEIGVAFAVSVVVLVLIVAMRLLEKQQEILQAAAFTRASVLERQMGLEISDVISDRFGNHHWSRYGLYTYFAFVAAVAVMAVTYAWAPYMQCAPLVRTLWGLSFLMIFVFSGALLATISRLKVYYARMVDWSLDRVQAEIGDVVGIMATSLDHPTARASFPPRSVAWRIVSESGVTVHSQVVEHPDGIHIAGRGSFMWQWSTAGMAPGVYGVIPAGFSQPLIRRIRLCEKTRH